MWPSLTLHPTGLSVVKILTHRWCRKNMCGRHIATQHMTSLASCSEYEKMTSKLGFLWENKQSADGWVDMGTWCTI